MLLKKFIKQYTVRYCIGGTKILPVRETDKKTIISEVNKIRETKTSWEVGNVP